MPTALIHSCVRVRDIDAGLAQLAQIGVQPEKQPYRVEPTDGGAFSTPKDGPHPAA